MRVIEPKRNFSINKPVRRKLRLPRALLLFAVVAVVAFMVWGKSQRLEQASQNQQNMASTTKKSVGAERKLRTFTADQFRDLYNTLAYPNVQEITDPLPITGNAAADERIRKIAEQRGYQERSMPVSSLTKTDKYYLQQRAAQDWVAVKEAAAKDNIQLSVGSGFRDPLEQRELFLSSMRANQLTAAQIASGTVDAGVGRLLSLAAPPGYSRHHTGFAVDVACDSQPTTSFRYTVCFAWLNRNNYENAKRYGWIPSYPEGADQQGPEPEPWEYVWVGYDSVTTES